MQGGALQREDLRNNLNNKAQSKLSLVELQSLITKEEFKLMQSKLYAKVKALKQKYESTSYPTLDDGKPSEWPFI